jgi:flagellin-like hook-associated protein FlgL
MTGTYKGNVQSQTVSLADLQGYDIATSGDNDRVLSTNVNFSNFGIELRLTSTIEAGTTETGAALAAAITAKSTSIVVDGKGGQISNVKLSGVNPGTYQMTFGNTGSVSAFGMPAGLVSGQTSAGTARSVALVGGNGSGATANISYDAQGVISSIAVNGAGTGYKAGDVLSTAAVTAGTVNAASISTVQGAGASTESASVTFAALNAGQTVTLGGLTFTAGAAGANATQVANAFANLQNGAITGLGTQLVNGSGTYLGTFNGWSTGAANGSAIQFTSSVANQDVDNLAAGSGSASVVINTTQGASLATQTQQVVFAGLKANASFTLGGHTFTAGTVDLTADQVAFAFTGLAGTETTTAGLNAVNTLSGTTGTFTAAGVANGFSTSGASRTSTNISDDTLVFTSTTAGVVSSPLTVASEPTITTTAGAAGAITEAATFTFVNLTAGQSINIGGLMFTAGTANVSAANVASAFAGLQNGATTGSGTSYGTYSGALTGYATAASSGASLEKVVFTSQNPGVNVSDLAAVAGTSTFLSNSDTTVGSPTTTAVKTVVFSAGLEANRTATINGLTITAGSTALTQTQLTAAFANLSNGTTAAQLNAGGQGGGLGVFSGTFSGWSTGAVTPGGTSLVFTSSTPNIAMADIALTTATQPSVSLVQGNPGGTESASVAFTALSAYQSISMGGLTYQAGASGNTADEVATAFQNLSAGDAPTTLAARNETATATFTAGTSLSATKTITLNGLTWTAGSSAISAAELSTVFQSITAGTAFGAVTSAAITALTTANKGSFTAGAAISTSGAAATVGGNEVVTFTATNQNVTDLATTLAATPGTISVTTATTQQGVANAGTYTGTFSGWNTGSSSNATVAFTSTTPATDVNNLTATVAQNPTVSVLTTGVAAATEIARATFNDLTANQITTINGKTFTAGASGATGADVATAFATGTVNAGTGVLTGSYSAEWTNASTVTNTNQVVFTAAAAGNKTDLASPVAGQAPVIVTTQQGGSTNSTETAQVTFDATAMTSGDTVTVGGLTFTAGANGATRAQVAAAFSNLPAGTSSANLSSVNGTFSGTLTGWSTGSSNGTGVSFTSTTASAGVDDLTSSVSRRQALNALSGIVVGGLANQTGENLLTMSGLVNGSLQTQALSLKDNAANSTQTLNFSMFGVQFDVDSFQAQTAGDIGTVLASLNSSSANYGTSGAFTPGQVVVSQGANSALKFQSGADSSSFIQIDTLNIQTGSSGVEAGSDKPMMDVGSAIADSGVGKLGALGLNDSIDTWQTAFKNAAAAVDEAIEYVSSKRATYGSQMNRLSFVTTNLVAQSTNLQNSRSAIIDTDFASETAKLTKGQIMQQAATAMLAQANQMPNVILSLLK